MPPPRPRSIPSPQDGEVEVRERGFQESATIRWNEPLSPALSPLVPRREREREIQRWWVYQDAPKRWPPLGTWDFSGVWSLVFGVSIPGFL